ncbi:hypothetical protein [Salirhabdus sp. Marseille-P4669]|nr:hypothetical protein [Salirhabdus sp. Marseille-P4669]
MWQSILIRIPDPLETFAIISSFAIPFLVYKINQKLHESGDPPWKK